MKPRLIVIALIALILAGGLAVAQMYTTGFGTSATASTTHVQLKGFVANSVSVYNTDASEPVFALVNSTTNVLGTRITAGTAIEIPGQAAYTFDAAAHSSISSVSYATTNGTAAIKIAAF